MTEEKEKMFSRVKLKVARIIDVKRHPNADKLYVETITLGDEEREIVSGLVPYYKEEELVGKNIILVANLKPAKLRGVLSNGMLLAAEADGKIEVIFAGDAVPGERIKIEGTNNTEEERQDDIATDELTIEEFFSVQLKVEDYFLCMEEKKLLCSKGPIMTTDIKDGKVT